MKKRTLNNKGAVTVITVMIFSLLILGFSAVVIDAGVLYSSRKAMVTSADAAALAGAKEMEKVLGVTNSTTIASIKAKAIAIAKETAKRNGSGPDPTVELVKMNIRLNDGSMSNRDVIVVSAKRTENLIFFRFLNKYTSNVSFKAAATWGYIRTLRSGQLLPLYLTEENYETSHTLHGGRSTFNDTTFPNQHGFIYLDPAWNGQNVINDAIAGNTTKISMSIDTEFEGKSGVANSVIAAVETRFVKAQKLGTPTARRDYMYGLVPVVELSRTQGNKLYFQIKTFAVVEILDIMINANKGSPEALYGNNYTRIGTGKTYNPEVEGVSYDKGALLVRFTGEIRQVEVVIQNNDQTTNPTIPDSAKYSKLVQ